MGNRIELEGVIYKYKFKSPILNIEQDKLSEKQMLVLFESTLNLLKVSGEEYQGTIESLESFRNRLGFGGFSHGKTLDFFCEAYIPSIPCNTPFNCPERGLVKIGDDPRLHDDWVKIGKYRICSFCGSMNPDDLIEAIGEIGVNIIDYTDKGYKWYIKLPGVINAGLGPIKYYRWHDTPEFLETLKQIFEHKDSEGGVTIKDLCSRFKAKGTLSIKKD